tara:strand:- start:10145 stop:10342 length:198 start_codon:yes stop_codon:yes gene_type:complete
MNKLWKYSYYVYLIIALILVVEGILQLNKNKQTAIVIFGIAILVLFKFFFTKKFRDRIEKRNQER